MGMLAVHAALPIIVTAALDLPLSTSLTLYTKSALLATCTGKTRGKLSPQEQYVSGGNCPLLHPKGHEGRVVKGSPVRTVDELGWRSDRSAGMDPCPG